MTEPKKGWFQRLTAGLSRSSKQMTEQVVSTFTKQPLDQAKLDELEEMLIEADLGPHSAARITERFAAGKFRVDDVDDQRFRAVDQCQRFEQGGVLQRKKVHSGRCGELNGLIYGQSGAGWSWLGRRRVWAAWCGVWCGPVLNGAGVWVSTLS